jgi:hypothetical protein
MRPVSVGAASTIGSRPCSDRAPAGSSATRGRSTGIATRLRPVLIWARS